MATRGGPSIHLAFCGADRFRAWALLAATIWLVALGLVWLVATRFSRPIVKDLTQALKSLADGNFRIRVPNGMRTG